MLCLCCHAYICQAMRGLVLGTSHIVCKARLSSTLICACTQVPSHAWSAPGHLTHTHTVLPLTVFPSRVCVQACQAVRGLLLGTSHIVPSSELHLGPGVEMDSRSLGQVPPVVELALTTFGVVEVLLAGYAAAVAATQQVRCGWLLYSKCSMTMQV